MHKFGIKAFLTETITGDLQRKICIYPDLPGWVSSCFRCHTRSTSGVLLQVMLDIETELHLHEFLKELHRQDGTSFSPPADLNPLLASAQNPCPSMKLRAKAIRRIDECLTAVEHLNENGDLTEICVATMWNIAKPCIGPTFRQHVYRSLQKVNRDDRK